MYVLIVLMMLILCCVNYQEQRGGDPYAWIRPWIIIDMLRNFWLTR